MPTAPHRADVRLAFQEASVGTHPTTTLSGVFVAGAAPWHNLADCLTSPWQVCTQTAPAEQDAWVSALRRAEIEPPLSEALTASPAGETIASTGYEAPWRPEGFDIGLYHAVFDGIALPDEAAGVSFEGGVWGMVWQQQILPVPTRLWVTHPSPITPFEASDVGTTPLRWTPGSEGDVTLLVGAPGHSRVYTLADDGAFDLDLSGLDLPSGSTLDVVLQRHTTVDIAVGSHPSTLEVASVQPLVGTWMRTADRTPLDLPDRCEDAGAPALTPGSYIGAFGDYQADHDPGAGGCAGGFPQAGPDAVLPVRLEPWEQLQVTSRLPNDDGSVYLLVDCTDATLCLTGADGAGVGGAEALTWTNDSETAQTVWLVLDGYGDVTGPALLDVTVTALGGEALAPTCLEAIENGPVPDGTYAARLDAPSALAPPCAAGAAGGERIAQVEVFPNETLSVQATAAAGAPQVYLMWNCSVVDSCFAASEASELSTASLDWWNDSDVSQRVYVVVDGVDVGEVEVVLSAH